MASYEELKKRVNGSGSSEDDDSAGKRSYEDIKTDTKRAMFSEDVAKVDHSYISTFFDDVNKYFTAAESDYKNLNWGNASYNYQAKKDTADELQYRQRVITKWLYDNQGSLDEETYTGLMESLDAFSRNANSVVGEYNRAQKYYSAWDSEDAYKADLAAYEDYRKGVADLAGGYDVEANRQEGQEGWNDFVAYQEERARKQAEAEKRAAEEEAKKNDGKYTFEEFWEDLGRWMGPGTNPDTSLPLHVDTYQMSQTMQNNPTVGSLPTDQWTDDQKYAFGFLWKQDQAKAYEYGRALNTFYGQAAEAEEIQKIQEGATKNFWTGAAHTAGALLTSPLGMADYLYDVIEYGATGQITGGADSEITPFEYSQAVTSGITNQLNGVDEFGVAHNVLPENIPIIGGKGVGDLYGLGTSILQSSLASATGGSGQALVTFFGSASAAGVDDAVRRGITGERALLYGTALGAAEAGAEMIGIDNLFKIGSSSTFKQLMLNHTKQGGAEALEEGLTGIFGNVADWVFSGDKSNFNLRVKELVNNGLSESAAKRKAWGEAVGDIIYDSLGGFVSGFAHAAPRTAIHTFRKNRYGKATYGNSQQELVSEALEIDPNNAFAKEMQARLDAGKSLTGAQLADLAQQNETAMIAQDMDSIQKAIEARLIELGETGDVSALAAALAKQVRNEYAMRNDAAEVNRLMKKYGISMAQAMEMAEETERQELTRAEEKLLESSKYGQRVANELSTENIRSGGDSSAWAESIDTNRINAAEYSRLVEAAQLPQEAAEATGGKVVTDVPKEAQAQQAEPVAAVEVPAATADKQEAVPANDQQITGKLTGKESLQVDEKPAEAEAPKAKAVSLEDVSKKYGAQAQAMIHTYQEGQNVAKFDQAYQAAYDMGRSGVGFSYVKGSEVTAYLTDSQKELAYNTGKDAADAKAKAKDAENKAAANGKTGWKQGGVVRGEGVSIADLPKNAYKILSNYSKATGLNIVLYKSKTDADGNFIGEQGAFNPDKPNEVRIDIYAGLENVSDVGDFEKYVLLRTFSHEFTHFIEKWNPIQYNEFRKVVFDTLTERGENAHDLIETKMKDTGLGYEAASREVVADAMTDILPDSSFVQQLAEKHKSIFTKLLEKLKEFVENLREYFDSLGYNEFREANALKEQVGDTIKYLDSIVQLFDNVAVQAVENFQQTVATEEVAVSKKETTTTETATVFETESVAVTEEVAPVVEKDDYGFTISDNVEHGSLEITFDGKSSDTVRDVLKENKFRWHKAKKLWYGYGERDAIRNALHAAYKADEAAATATPEQSDFEKSFWNATQEERDEVVNAIQENTKISHIAPTEIRERADAVENKEVNDNGITENGTDTPAVHEPVRGSEGSARLLEGVEPETVHGSNEGRQPVQSGSDQGAGDAGRDGRADIPAEDSSEPSTGDRVGGNLQQLPAVTEAAEGATLSKEEQAARDYAAKKGHRIALNSLSAQKGITQVDMYDQHDNPVYNPIIINEASDWNKVKEAIDKREAAEKVRAEKLREIVVDLTAQRSTENPKGSNFVIGDSLNLPNGTKARTRANIDAIKLVKQIAAEGRIATPAEQEILSKYVGWGGLADAFGKPVSNYTTRKIEYEAVKGLEAEFEELKTVLTEEEYKSARESTKNAHYTSIEVIKAMYDGLKQLGFTGGRMLEPSSGVGNFVGAMPADMTSQVKSWTMVELDNITGLFAKYLYPNADVRIQGFEEANIPDGYMDVAIGNVPFGNYAITDKHYPKAVTSAIHNYFFAKSLDKVRTGGIVMFITSAYTMNSRDNAVRKYIMQRADLLGAIRLPNTAFAGNAGTSVVTDILILKKRADKTAYAGEAFENSDWQRLPGSYDGAYFNEYFAQHPEMVLGKPKLARGMYSANELTYDPFTDRGSLGDQIRSAMGNIKGKMDYFVQPSAERQNIRQATAKKKAQKLQVKDGVIHAKDENGNLTRVDVDKDTAERITGMVAIRDAHTALCDALQQGVTKKEITSLRKTLNKAYDAFVEKYGYLNATKNKKAINAFADRYAILSLENYSTEGKKIVATKSDIFSKDTIAANKTAASAENVEEGLTISLNTVGSVDVSMIARLTGQKVESVTRQLIDQRLVFKDKDGNLIPAAQYLSGNVRAKLREMEGLVGIDSDYQNNVEALREVVPPTVQHTDIYVNPGANWVPVEMYEGFVGHILRRSNHVGYRTGKKDFSVEYVPETNEYKVSINDAYAKMSAQNTQVWGEGGKAFSTIFENMLNGRRTNVYMEGADGKRVLDKAKTEAVSEKVEKLNEEFRKWLWEDEARRSEMQELYNESYNALVTPKYSGASLTVNGLNSEYDLRPHQKDAVARIINSGGNTLLAHRVGAGKTMEMAAAAMKLKQLGVIKKPMFVVPNNVVAQWGKEFKDYFPAANILLVGDEDMTPAERMTTINKIKNNDYDAVILAYTKFEKIQMTSAWRQKFYEEQIESIMFAINAEKESQGGKGFTVKQLENKRKQLEARVKKLTEKAKDDDGAMFEDLGVDSLFVDEAHNFKNLEYSTRMSNVSGLSKAEGAQRSFDLYTKVRYLQQLNGGRGVVFATATPVMNSMTEMYIMQKYLQADTLKQLGIEHFDSWAKMFGEVVNALEIAPSGSGYRLKQTFSKFKNVKALQQLFRSFTDVLTDVPGLKIPKMKGRKVQIVECEQGEFQKHYMEELAKRAENVKNVDPTEDNMLKITSDGRKISYSQRMIDPSLPYEETGKIYKCCENVFTVYQESNATKGTQMIFCDMATPKGKASAKTESDTSTDEFAAVDMESAQLYDDIKSRLVQLGIPAKEIAFIHDAKNDKQKAELSEKMNNGTIRVLIGSTGKMGVGLNAQKKAIAIHHLDAPWRPGDIEQRDGRVFRQKNQNEEAYKFVYVTRGSFDSRLWDILERKQKFINQVMNGEDVGNEIEDTGEVTLSAAEVKAVASDNPLIMEQVALEKEISKLQSLQQAHRANVSRAEEKIVSDRRNIVILENLISNLQEDIKSRKDTYSSDKVFSIQIGAQIFTDKKDAGAALVAAAEAHAVEGSYTAIGKFAGFTLRVVKTPEGVKGMVAGAGNYDFKTYPLAPTQGINHLIAVVEGFDERLSMLSKNLSEAKSDLETQKQLAAEPFEQAEKLKEKRARYNEVMDILNPPKEEQSLDSDGGDTVQYQKRNKFIPNPDALKVSPAEERETFERMRQDQMRRYMREHDGEIPGVWCSFGTSYFYVYSNLSFLKYRTYSKMLITGNEEIIDAISEGVIDGRITSSESYRSVLKLARSARQRSRRAGSDGAGGRQGGRDAGLAGGQRGSNRSGGDSGSNTNYAAESSDGVQFQQRTNTLTNREVLELAASELQTAELTAAERDALDIFQQRLAKLEALQEERAKQGRLYREQQFGVKVDRAAAEQTRSRMQVLDGQIEKAKAEVLSIEDKQVLNQVLQKARKVVEKQQWTKDQETLKRWRDRRNNAEAIKKYRDRIRSDVDELTNWVLHPDNKSVVKHIPDALKDTVIPFLSSINFMSKRSLGGGNPTQADKAFMEQLRKLAKVMENTVEVDEMYSNYNDLPPDFMKNLRSFMDTAQQLVDKNTGEYIINQMTAEELQSLSKVVRTLKKYIMQMNRFHVNAMFQHVSDAGESSIEFMAPLKPAANTGAVSNFVLWQQMRPAYAFERFGEGGKAIYDGLRRGQATLAFNTKKIQAFAEKAYTTAEVKAWESQVKTIRIGPDKTVKMPVSYIMGLYELSKREQAQGHIFGEGIRVATFKANGKKISDVGQTLTPGELNMILRELTPRQKEVADKLQQFMQKQGGEWGNHVTVARFGEKQFGEENYYPINSDGRHLQVEADEKPGAASLYALLNMGFTKQTQEKAKNRLIVYSIFDVFSNHMASMAQYNAFALPVIDALKWFNYQQVEVAEDGSKTILGSVREQMDRAFGVPEENRPGSGKRGYAQSFVINIIKGLNGTEAQGTQYDSFGMQTLHHYNRAQIAYNLRVVVQQPMAITRAAQLLDYGSILKGMKLSPAAIKKNIEEMLQYSGIAAWKDLGFYDVNISRGLTSLIKHDDTLGDKIVEFGTKGAEWADKLTWAAIWSAAKEEVIRKQKIKPNDKGFYEAVTKLFEDVIYKTQVVDSVLTKNEFMRDKGFFARAVGSFMSEPTTTGSMLVNAYDKYHMDLQRGMTRQQAWKKNSKMIVRTAYVYGIGALILAAVQAVADAFRDDDDYQEWYEKWLEAFGGNLVDELMPFNKLPVLSQIYEFAKELIAAGGFDIYGQMSNFVWTDIAEQFVKGVEIIYGKITGDEDRYTWYGGAYKLLQGASGLTGLPMAAATREIVTAWNNTVGAMAPSLKVKTYDSGDKNEIKYAYQDGYLTEKEATALLLEKGIVDTEDEAYFTIRGWESGEGYSKYDAIYDAVRNGGDITAAMNELTSHGYKKKDVLSQVKSKIGEWYKDGEITKQQAIDTLTKYFPDMDSEEITATVNKWSSKVVTGIAFEDIKDEFMEGNITEARAIDMYVRYGGYSKAKATETVTKWRAEKETGVAYDDIKEAFMEGEISESDAQNMYITYGGYTQQEATEKVAVLAFVKKHPNCDGISFEAIEDYQTYCEPHGVPAKTYYDVWKYNSKTDADVDENGESISGSKKAKVLNYIDSLNLTYAQKDSLYYAFGWAESKINEAPWH